MTSSETEIRELHIKFRNKISDLQNGNSETRRRLAAEGEEDEGNEKKRAKTSTVWMEFKEITLADGSKKGECVHCKRRLAISASKSTTQFKRHLSTCLKRKIYQNQQQRISFKPIEAGSSSGIGMSPALTNGKFDMVKMREGAAHWILMHEHPFSIMEEEGFNMMQKRGMPEWEKVSHLWKSSHQKIEYMVLTAHFIDCNWRLQKLVISFVHIPPPRRGVEIADCIFRCLKEWGIENKVFTISVDNASSNDVAIKILKDTFSRTKRLLCGGKMFHVRCCAHILNLMVQDGISEIEEIIEDIHESVKFVNQNEARLKSFSDILQQLQLPERKLILDCKTRWNSTFEMLSIAIKFKEVFPMYKDRESLYRCCPSPEDWEKVEKICEILEVFNAITKIISGSDYPTSNLFLNEVYCVKVLLDKRSNDGDNFIQAMVGRMRRKFDKYWGECNLLMSVAAILDPRCKMRAVEFSFSKMYSDRDARENIVKVREALYDIYEEYVREYQVDNEHSGETSMLNNDDVGRNDKEKNSGWSEFSNYVKSVEKASPQHSDLDAYLAEGCFFFEGDPNQFDALEWWKGSTLKYRILSRMARDILAIPITTVASEASFSAGSRVIDTYRASLDPETVQALLCGGDWCRNLHGVKKKNKVSTLLFL
ncbi:Tam3-transposase (Ac family) protein [Dioscorea alata]|uniref:Tam3-transposase (Ac family) protein n=1 Tax=Dioscorea alata TaxID=55571 RepID=A0ACB7W223_DIOAL|nr:Tam3-transposase (Ac family) protein [Dioscorea alata]